MAAAFASVQTGRSRFPRNIQLPHSTNVLVILWLIQKKAIKASFSAVNKNRDGFSLTINRL